MIFNKKMLLITTISLLPKIILDPKLKCKEINSIFVSLTPLPQKDKNLTGKAIEIIKNH